MPCIFDRCFCSISGGCQILITLDLHLLQTTIIGHHNNIKILRAKYNFVNEGTLKCHLTNSV